MSEIKVSIIVPVYNVEEYLVKSLDSLVNQTLQEIEIICINDGSTDNSLDILNAYSQKDNRIIVINKENEGQGIARNLGISKARGEYIGFVDPDDWVSLEMYEKMYNQAKQLESEIVICDFIKYENWSGKSWKFNFWRECIADYKSEIFEVPSEVNLDKEVIYKSLLVSPCYAWNKIYKTDFIKANHISFSTIRCFEDIIFIINSMGLTQRFSYVDIPLYNYRLRKDSTSRKQEVRYKDMLYMYDKIVAYFEERNLYNKFKKNIDYFIFANAFWLKSSLVTRKYKNALDEKVKKYLSKDDYQLFIKRCKQKEKLTIKKVLSVTNYDKYKIINICSLHINLPRYKFRNPIDLVYCWVDGNDAEWQKDKIFWQEKLGIPVTDAVNPCRFVDNEELRYSLRSVAKNLPWINHIYIVTNGQVPKWLNTNHPKITIVNHKDIMPVDALPVFSAYPIETCLANIPNLSNYFLYANDDFFVYEYVSPDYFFDKSGKPILRFCRQSKSKKRILNELYLQNVIYSGNLIYQKFGQFCDYETTHNIDSYRKDYFLECKEFFEKEFRKTTYSKFTSQNLVQRTIVNFYMLVKKSCKSRVLRTKSKRRPLENIYISMSNPVFMDRKIQKHRKRLKLFCINDYEGTKQENRSLLKPYLELLYPNAQDWELIKFS